MKPKKVLFVQKSSLSILTPTQLIKDVRQLIESARQQVAHAINAGLVMLNWHIGQRIRKDILGRERAEYGQRIMATLSHELTQEYGSGYTVDALARMVKFYGMYSNREIVATLSQQLGWSHFVQLLSIDDRLKRDFYAEMCRVERWSVLHMPSSSSDVNQK